MLQLSHALWCVYPHIFYLQMWKLPLSLTAVLWARRRWGRSWWAAVGSFLRCIPVHRLLMLLLWQMVTLRSKLEVLSGITPGVRSNIRICRDPALNNDVMAGPSPPLPDASGWVAGTVLLVGSGQRSRRPTGPPSSHQSRTHRLLLRRTRGLLGGLGVLHLHVFFPNKGCKRKAAVSTTWLFSRLFFYFLTAVHPTEAESEILKDFLKVHFLWETIKPFYSCFLLNLWCHQRKRQLHYISLHFTMISKSNICYVTP